MAEQQGWTRFFRKADGVVGEDVLSRVLGNLAALFEGGSLDETLKSARESLKKIFACSEVSIFVHDPTIQPSWIAEHWGR